VADGAPGLAALAEDPSADLVRDLLHGVIDPELGIDIVACLAQAPNLRHVLVESELDPPWRPEDMSEIAREALGWKD
jgi:metal-sulfur cluster biosynthetic enzyme